MRTQCEREEGLAKTLGFSRLLVHRALALAVAAGLLLAGAAVLSQGQAEAGDDWYGLRKDGSVDFCGEVSRNYDTFPGDNPVEPSASLRV